MQHASGLVEQDGAGREARRVGVPIAKVQSLGWQWGRCCVGVLIHSTWASFYRDSFWDYVPLGFAITCGLYASKHLQCTVLTGLVSLFSVNCVHGSLCKCNLDWVASCVAN